jgi:hypothetical protein
MSPTFLTDTYRRVVRVAEGFTAVGFYSSSAGQATLAEAWNGTTCTQQVAPNPVDGSFMHPGDVSCTGPAVWSLVGLYQGGSKGW